MDQQNMNNEYSYQAAVQPESVPQKGKGFSIAALVLGIVGICVSFIPIVNSIAYILGLFAIIFAVIALAEKAGTKSAIISIVLGVLAIAITLVMQVILLNILSINNGKNTLVGFYNTFGRKFFKFAHHCRAVNTQILGKTC